MKFGSADEHEMIFLFLICFKNKLFKYIDRNLNDLYIKIYQMHAFEKA